MSRFKRLKKSPQVLLGNALCCDCGMDTMPRRRKLGTYEQFIVKDEVWKAAGMEPGTINSNNELIGGGFLCIGCIEKRLGRRLTIDDIKPICIPLALGSPWNTERLRLRMLYRTQEEGDVAKISEPTKWRADFAPEGFGLVTTIAAPKVETRGL